MIKICVFVDTPILLVHVGGIARFNENPPLILLILYSKGHGRVFKQIELRPLRT
jgi:hypothetical protein